MTLPTSEYTFETVFIRLFKKHEYRLYTLAACFTKSDQFAKDIVQVTFLKLWDKRDSIKYVDNIEQWLYRQAESNIIHFLKKAAAVTSVRDALWVNMQQPFVNEDEASLPNSFNFLIENAIQHLPPQRQNIYCSCKDNSITYDYIKRSVFPQGLMSNKTNILQQTVKKVKTLLRF